LEKLKKKIMRNVLSLFVLIALIVVCASSCSEDSVSSGNSVSQETIDNKVAYSLNMAFNETFSQIEITPVTDGEVNVTLYYPAGGHAVITGSITVDEQTGRVNWFLTYGWWSYKVYESDKTFLTFNGLMTFTGFTNQYTMSFSMNSSSISTKGKVDSKDINVSCSFALNANFNSSTGHGTITGNECGRSINYTF
jgi:hypothetical protein